MARLDKETVPSLRSLKAAQLRLKAVEQEVGSLSDGTVLDEDIFHALLESRTILSASVSLDRIYLTRYLYDMRFCRGFFGRCWFICHCWGDFNILNKKSGAFGAAFRRRMRQYNRGSDYSKVWCNFFLPTECTNNKPFSNAAVLAFLFARRYIIAPSTFFLPIILANACSKTGFFFLAKRAASSEFSVRLISITTTYLPLVPTMSNWSPRSDLTSCSHYPAKYCKWCGFPARRGRYLLPKPCHR